MTKYRLVWNASLLTPNEKGDNDQIATFTNTVDFDHWILAEKVGVEVGKQIYDKLVEFVLSLENLNAAKPA